MTYTQTQAIRRMKNLVSELDYAPTEPSRDQGYLGLSDKEIRDYSVMRGATRMLDIITGNCSRKREGFDGFEAECSRSLEKVFGMPVGLTSFFIPKDVTHHRAMATIPGGKGGYAVGAEIVGFIDPLLNASVCFQLGAQRITNQAENGVLVKETTGPTATWQGPNGSSVAAADAGFTQLTATPHTVISMHELSEQLLRQASPLTEAGMIRGLGQGLAVGVDQAMLTGSGGNSLLGILNTPNVSTVSGTAITRAVLVDMQKQANDANAVIDPSAQGYVATPTIAALLAGRQQFSGVDSPLWAGTLARGTVAGAQAMSTKSLNAGNLIFGSFSQLMLVEFGPMQIAVNRSDTRFSQGVVAIRAMWIVDAIVLEPKAFTFAVSVT